MGEEIIFYPAYIPYYTLKTVSTYACSIHSTNTVPWVSTGKGPILNYYFRPTTTTPYVA